MKKNKHISQINLVLFLLSFFLFSVNTLTGSTKNSEKLGNTVVSAKQGELPDSSLQLSEENERENDFEILAFIIPFFFLSITIDVFRRTIFSYPSPLEQSTRPIYVSVRNFRI